MSEYPTTRISLLMRVRDPQDHQAWSDFVTLYRPVLYRFARRRGFQSADAHDLAQTVLTTVAGKIGDWEPDEQRARFRTWLSRVAQNQAISMFRRSQTQRAQAAGGSGMVAQLNELADPVDADSDAIIAEYRREIFRYAARIVREEFEETTWQAFWLTSVEMVQVADAAKSLGRSCGSIYTSRSRVIRRLQEVVQRFVDEDETLTPLSPPADHTNEDSP